MREGDIFYTTPESVRFWRLWAGLSAAELSRLMGYSRSYVTGVETGKLRLTRRFSERFWSVVSGRGPLRVVEALMSTAFTLTSGRVRILRQPRACDCGCGVVFVPSSSRHRFVDKSHGKRHRRRLDRRADTP